MPVGHATRKREGEQKPTRYYSTKQETHVAKTLGANVTKNSGATMFDKGDITLGDGAGSFLIECKTKTSNSNSISIQKEWIRKNREEACFMGKENTAIVFSFGPDEENFYIIDEFLFKKLVELLESEA